MQGVSFMFLTFPVVILMIADDDDRVFMQTLYADYYRIMRTEAYLILGRSEPIDDLIQDACVKLIKKIPTLRALDCCKLHAYVVSTITSITKNFIKRSDVQKKHTYLGRKDDARDIISESVADDAGGVEGEVLRGENLKLMREVFLKLPERDRDILEYKYILSMSDKQIGEMMDIKASSVRELLTRARRKALRMMKEGDVTHVN